MRAALTWIGAFLVLAFVLTYWQWIVGALVLGVVVGGVYLSVSTVSFRRRKERVNQRARDHALAVRAQAQHEQYLDGDERGLYGNYRPAPLD